MSQENKTFEPREIVEQRLEKAEALLAEAGEIVERQRGEAEWLREGMAELQLALEDRGWSLLNGRVNQREFNGLDLDVIKGLSDELRAYLTGGALAKRLIEVRSSFVVGSGGLEYTNVTNAKRALDDTNNQRKLFSSTGIAEVMRAYGTDGTVFIAVNPKTKKIRRIPLHNVEALYVDPDDPEDILFIKESYSRIDSFGRPTPVKRWIRVDTNDAPAAKRKSKIQEGAEETAIDKEWTVVVSSVNVQVGHTLGTPDLLASLPWLERYNEYLITQLDFQKALSAIAVHIKSKTTRAQNETRSAIAGGGKAGIATTGVDTSIEAQRGGSDVSFENGRPIAAMAATGAEVSVVHALSDPGASGSSYGSAQTLDSPTQKMIAARRELISGMLKRVFLLLGAEKVVIKWPRVEDEATFRLVQAVGLMWESGLFSADEIRVKLAELVDMSITGKAPTGVLIPNNENSVEAEAKIKADNAPASAGFGVNAQGKDALGQGKMNDQRGDRPDRPKGE